MKIAEPLTCSGYDDRLDIFQVCSILLSEDDPEKVSEDLLSHYLTFFGNVLELTFNQSDLPYGVKKLIYRRADEFELYQRLIGILDDAEKSVDYLKKIAKIVYHTTSKPKIVDLNKAREFDIHDFIGKLYDFKAKYLVKLAVKIIRFHYEIRHEQANISNEAYNDLRYCDWLIIR